MTDGLIAVWFSCGAASAAAAKLTIDKYGAHRAKQSRELGVRLARYRGERVFLDELPRTDEGQMEMNFDCGVFCEEPAR